MANKNSGLPSRTCLGQASADKLASNPESNKIGIGYNEAVSSSVPSHICQLLGQDLLPFVEAARVFRHPRRPLRVEFGVSGENVGELSVFDYVFSRDR